MKLCRQLAFPVAAIITLFCSVNTGFAQESILGSAGEFTVLGGAAVTSTGTLGTVITSGNVGSAAAVTGFPPALVVGGVVTTDTTVVDPALANLIQAANGLSNMTSTAEESGLNLGGMTLLPGIYTFSSSELMDGTLTLNANGQNNAVWVFQIGSTLTTAANSAVVLINPGTLEGIDDGIYWDVGTSITMGADNQILGNYLAGSAITVGSSTSGSGRVLAQTGVSLDNDQINSNGGPGGGWTSGLMYNAMGNVVPVPEPVIFMWLAALGGVTGLICWWRKTRVLKIIA